MASRISSNINFSRFVSLGDSLTAGYADGALYYEAQQNSYVNILAYQFKRLGGGDFKQPLLDPASVGINQKNNSRLALKNNIDPHSKDLSLTYLAHTGDTAALRTPVYASQGPFNNLGVPGAKIISAVMGGYGDPRNGTGNYNPFFTRMAANAVTSSILSDAVALDPTFFSVFIGNNDALAFALTGGTEDAITPLTGPSGIGFAETLNAILNALTAKGAKGIIANIPDLITVPFFTCIPYDGLVLDNNSAYALSSKFPMEHISFKEGKNPFLVSDPEYGMGHPRPIKKGELILMDVLLDPDKLIYLTGERPIPKKYFLDADEIGHVQRAIIGYNKLIEEAARTRGLAFVDINSLVKKTKKDRRYNSQTYNLDYKKGVFSLDGLHPNPLGHALLANEFIKSINQAYNLSIPFVNMEPYKEISFSRFKQLH